MRQILNESGMQIPYETAACYMIEKSTLVAKLQGVKIVEFVQAEGKKRVKLLEAKTSAPSQHNTVNYNDYLREIREKFQNSILILNAAKMKRRENIYYELPQSLKDLDYKSANYWLYLVIKNSKDDWIVNLSDDLHIQLHPFLKCWNIPDSNFLVLNEVTAKKIGVVV